MHALLRFREVVTTRRSLVLVTLLAAASAGIWAARHTPCKRARVQRIEPEIIVCAERAASQEPVQTLQHVELERRWLVGQYPSPAAVDEALGTTIPAWQQFTYVFDSQPRQAIAGPIYPSHERRTVEFGTDEYGGIWLARETTLVARVRTADPVTYTRDIYLMPVGSSFRGVRF
jgi:hypothetical protein